MQKSLLNSLWQSFSNGSDATDNDLNAHSQSTQDETKEEQHAGEDQNDGDTTPKWNVQNTTHDIPSFALSSDEPSQEDDGTDQVSVQDDAAKGSTPSSNIKPVPTVSTPTSAKPATSSLMPPPSMKAPTKSLPSSNASLRLPSNGPLPNRGPPVNSQQRAGSSGRGKVLLSPGHSPMDWASLARSKNLSGVPALQRVTPSQMKVMNGRKGKPIWSSYQGKVYNVTPYLPFHPGGEKELMKAAGRDGTKLFMEIHPWVNWEGMLSSCMVGILVSEEEAKSSLDSLD